MTLTIKATKTTLTPSIKAAIKDKLSAIEVFLKPEHKVHVECEVDKKHNSGEVFRVEVTINPGNLYADASGEDFYAALDMAVPKIKQQLVKSKGKKLAERRKRK